MSDDTIGDLFLAVALPMCMLVLAFLFWNHIRRRDAGAAAAAAQPNVPDSRLNGALRVRGAGPQA